MGRANVFSWRLRILPHLTALLLIGGLTCQAAAQTTGAVGVSPEVSELLKAADALAAKKNFEEALKVLEPAAKLAPDNRAIQFQLLRYQWSRASQILAGPLGENAFSIEEAQKVSTEQIKQALELMRRAIAIRKASFEELKLSKPDVNKFDAERMDLWRSEIPVTNVMSRLNFLRSQPEDVQRAIADVRKDYRADVSARLEFLAELTINEPLQFPRFTRMVNITNASTVLEQAQHVKLWLNVRAKVGDVPHSVSDIQQQCLFLEGLMRALVFKPYGQQVDLEAESRATAATEIFDLFQKHADPALQGFGRVGSICRRLRYQEIKFDEFQTEFAAIRAWLQKQIQEAPIRTARLTQHEMYAIWNMTLEIQNSSELGGDSLAFQRWQQAEAFAIVDYMQSRKECFPRGVDMMVRLAHTQVFQKLPPVDSSERLQKMIELVDTPTCRFLDDDNSLQHRRDQWIRSQANWARQFPELAGAAGLPQPWKSAKKLWSSGPVGKPGETLFGGIVHNGAAYLLLHAQSAPLNGKSRLTPVRMPLDGSPQTEFTALSLDDLDSRRVPPTTLRSLSLDGQTLAVLVPREGIAIFELGDRPSRLLSEIDGVRFRDAQCVTLIGRSLYAGFGSPGMLVKLDLDGGVTQILFSGEKADNPEPFRDIRELRVLMLQADPARERIIFSVSAEAQREPLRNFQNQSRNALPQTGIWEFKYKTGEYRQLVPLLSAIPDWCEPFISGTTLFASREFLLRFDPVTNRVDPLQSYLVIPLNREIGLDKVPARGIVQPPVAVIADSIWAGEPLTRVNLRTGKVEPLAALERPNDRNTNQTGCVLLHPLNNGKQLVYGTRQSLWLLEMPESAGAAPPQKPAQPQ